MSAAAQPPAEIDVATVKSQLDSGSEFLLIDCREPDEHALVNIPQAMLLPMSQLGARVSEIEAYRNKPVVVHCHHGGRSLKVTMWMRQQGFSNVRSMAGGIDEWAISIDPSLPRY